MAKISEQRPSRNRNRILAMQAVFVLALGGIGLRLHYVQTRYGPQLLNAADKVENTTQIVLAQRGALLDRNGNRLAYDVPAYMLDIKTDDFTDLNALAQQLAPILGKSASDISQMLSKGNGHWVRWPNPVLDPDKQKILALVNQKSSPDGKDHTSAVTFTPTEQRVYPYGTFAANTLGYVTHDGVGAGGLEAQYNSVLSGQNGEIAYTRDIWGFPLQTTVHTTKQAVQGTDIQLTIDQTIQGMVETKMEELVKQYNPDHAAIIVEDPNTGEILGMSSRPTFNPNEYWNASPSALSTNWAINAPFEPGSTFKMVTLSAGLAAHVISLDDTFMSGHMQVADRTIWDWKRSGWGRLTFRQALEDSSNVGFATVALKLQWNNLLDYMGKFGLLHKTGIDLPAEGSSVLYPKSARGPVELATSGFGQGLEVTPMQQMAAYAAIANGGKLIQPHLAKALVDSTTGKVVKQFNPVVENPQVVPKDVVDQVNNTLVLDVSEGIDDKGKIPGYDVAGKTGTAQKINPDTKQYYSDRFMVSFIGYAPASNPKFEVFVTLDWPKTAEGNQWGSTVATPAARDILQECLQYAHIPQKQGTVLPNAGKVGAKPSGSVNTKYVQTPDLTGKSIAAAQAALKRVGLVADVMGASGTVKSQWPAPGIEVPVGSRMYVWAPGTNGNSGVMPDLTGVSMREAGDILAALGVTMVPKGDGFAIGQSIAAGQAIRSGQTVSVTFEPPKDPVDQVLANIGNGSTANSTSGTANSGGN